MFGTPDGMLLLLVKDPSEFYERAGCNLPGDEGMTLRKCSFCEL